MKKIISIVLAIAIAISFAFIPGAAAQAADYPTITARQVQYSGEADTLCTVCEYNVVSRYKYEKIVVDIYRPDGSRLGGTSKTIYNSNSFLATGGQDTFSYSAKFVNIAPGTTLTVVAKMQYSTDNGSTYVDAPGAQTTTFVVTAKAGSHSNEWYNGFWYNADGSQTYNGTLFWEGGGSNWYVIDSKGWRPSNQWLKIDGTWYYFTSNGAMDYSEYRDGYWLNADGSCSSTYTHGKWCSDSKGWWYEDNGWYPTNQSLWIDGVKYYFGADGYMK